jgi:hypothetical protein
MAVEWKKVLLEGDAAAPSDADPAQVGTVLAAGAAATCSRADHVHTLGVGCINNANLLAADVVETAAIANANVTSAKLKIDANFDMEGNQALNQVAHTVANEAARLALTPVVGKFVWQTDELRPYFCTSSA